MIADKFVDLYARSSGLRDKLVAELDVVLTYALRALNDSGVMAHLAFKGGTCLRKTVFGSAGRFSEDLDFTLDTTRPDDDVLVELVDVLNREHYGITFIFEEYYKTEGDKSFGGEVRYRHAWNAGGRFRLQVSLRERPTLAITPRALMPQAYFGQLEFEPFGVRSLEVVEMVAEKVRAAFQRAKVRDLYDLHRFATTPFDGTLLRRLAVLKLWQVEDRFDADAFFQRIRGSRYDWDDLRRLMRAGDRLDANDILRTVEARFASLRELSDLERSLIADGHCRNQRLADELRAAIRAQRTRLATD
jgi:predicted nucleotidyltransferase component of viral defense system